MSSAGGESFTSSFPVWICFISFSCLIGLTRISNTMLNKSGESGYPCLVLDLRSFHFFTVMYDVTCGLVVWPLLCWSMFPLYLLYWVFIINGCWILSDAFSAFVEMIIWFLFFILLMWCIMNHLCISGINPTWSWCMYFYRLLSFNVLLNPCWHFVEDFCIFVLQGYWPVFLFLWHSCLVLVSE